MASLHHYYQPFSTMSLINTIFLIFNLCDDNNSYILSKHKSKCANTKNALYLVKDSELKAENF